MSEERGRVRIRSKYGVDYMVTDSFAEVADMLHSLDPDQWLELTCIHGQRLFGTEQTLLRVGDVSSIQEVSAEAWAWNQHATELYYARQLADYEQSPTDRIAEVQERLIKVIAGEDPDE